ncbi:MAG: polysaccharide pyruvyl transferase family protein [Sedimentisphaerales bacterium]|nr:polysaccharide pyruvyl transferase family protein [Sedimentisphaerales bacterium]
MSFADLITMPIEQSDTKVSICLLGPSFDTGNLGVNALVEGSIKVIVSRWPNARVTLLGSGREDCEYRLELFGREIRVKSLPIRFCKNIFLSNHFIVLFLYGLLLKVFRFRGMRRRFANRNSYLKTILEADLVADITGGDSFSDIYGMRRFVIGFLRKWLIKIFGKKLVLLPQTYGPFSRLVTKILARHIVNYAAVVYSRDKKGVDDARAILGAGGSNGKVKFVPDVGFLLDPRRPSHGDIDELENLKVAGRTLVGLNISGLLSCCAEENVFNLKIEYPALVISMVELLMKLENTVVLLVPHVVSMEEDDASPAENRSKKGYREQSDTVACRRCYEQVVEKYPGRIFMVRGRYNHNETKYIIGLCDFFIGSRMHACIAALSQCVPAVGVAYSGKFHGVFESIGVADCVADAREFDNAGILDQVQAVIARKEGLSRHLEDVMPEIKSDILNLFNVCGLERLEGVDLGA